MNAPRNSYERKRGVESHNVDIDDAVSKFSVDDTAAGRNPLQHGTPIEIEPNYIPSKLEQEKFMAEEVVVFMQEASSENEPEFVEVTVNGDYRLLRRGQEATIKRYHVAALARAKAARVDQKKIVNPDGSMGYEERMVIKVSYPFSVISDPSGAKGSDWLRTLLKAPV
jgi:hypothetical protein